MCYSEHYVEDTSQVVDSGISAWMECITVNIMWKILHSRWTVVLQLEWRVLQWTLCGRYFSAGGQCYCSLNWVCYSEHYVEDTSTQVDSVFAAWINCIQWTLCERYFTAGGQCYCSLNGVCYTEHYVEDTSQHVDSSIAAWMACVTVNIMWKILQRRWTHALQVELIAFSEHYVEDTSQQVDSGIAGWMGCVAMNIIWKCPFFKQGHLLLNL